MADPTVVAEGVTHFVTNPTLFAALIAISMALVKLLEVTITALVKKYSKAEKSQQVEVTFDDALTKKISDMSEQINVMHSVMHKTDNDGTPMVYSSRSGMEAVRDIAVIIRNVSQTQERLAHVMERLEGKFADHDRADHVIQSQINASIERMVKTFDEHDKRVSESINIQSDILRIAEQNQEAILRHLASKG